MEARLRLVELASLRRWKQGIHDYLESQRRGGRESDLQDTKRSKVATKEGHRQPRKSGRHQCISISV